MKTLYALAFMCLSVPSLAADLDFNDQPYIATESGYTHDLADDFDFRGESTAGLPAPVIPNSEDESDEIRVATDSSRAFDASDLLASENGAEHTATISAAVPPKSEEVWAEIWLGSHDETGHQRAIAAADAGLDDWR